MGRNRRLQGSGFSGGADSVGRGLRLEDSGFSGTVERVDRGRRMQEWRRVPRGAEPKAARERF